MFDFIADIFGGGGDEGFDLARGVNERNRQLLNQIELPDYDTFIPELLNYESADYQLTGEDPLVRAAQMDALKRLAGLAESGLSEVDAAGFDRARDQATQIARGEREAAIQNANARGVGGSGLEFAMREMGNQSAAERAQDAGLQTAAESARQRALYQQAFGNALSQQRSDDFRVNAANTGIINQFNRENTAGRNAMNQGNAQLKNSAFQYNQGLKDKRFQNQMSRATGQIGLNDKDMEIGLAENEQDRRRRGAMTGLIGAGIGGFATGTPQGAGLGYAIGSGFGG